MVSCAGNLLADQPKFYSLEITDAGENENF